MKKNLFNLIKIILLGTILSLGVAYMNAGDFLPPTQSPTGGNMAIPINAGPTPQAKGGNVLASETPLLDLQGTLSGDHLFTEVMDINGTLKLSKYADSGAQPKRNLCRDITSNKLILCTGTPPPSTKTLTLFKSGSGTGTVSSSSPAGVINCGTSCAQQSGQVVPGTQVVLNAVADPGFNFSQWVGPVGSDCNGVTVPVCSFIMPNEYKSITVAFVNSAGIQVTTAPITGITSTSAIGGGTVTGSTSSSFKGLVVGLTPDPIVNGFNFYPYYAGNGPGSFVTSIGTTYPGPLSPNTTYHARAFTTSGNGNDFIYGNNVSFTTNP